MTVIRDERTEEQKKTHPILVVATDRFMSGWGAAKEGLSYAAWACRDNGDDVRVFNWVRRRHEMSRVRVVLADSYKPSKYCAHLSIYAVEDGHPAL